MDEDRLTLLEAKVKEFKVQLDSIESNVKINDCCISETVADQEDADGKIEKLQERLTHLEWDLEPAISRLDIFKKTSQLEESIEVLKVQNIELRDHLNLVVDMVNNITNVLNKTFNNNELADEAIAIDNTQADNEPADEVIAVDDDEPTAGENEPTQLTLRQVYDMYQSQPPDEEGWQEMTKAIEAAEEYEASLQKQQELSTTVNGLTQDEWNDLLRI